MSKADEFKVLLRQLFQLDLAELDFGIYRILGLRRAEIQRFLDEDLLPEVSKAFEEYKASDRSLFERQLAEAIRQARDIGVNPEEAQKVKELRKHLAEESVDVNALEEEVFSELYTFFSRYYNEGDFISQRRYKDGVYAIPYEGEEVKLHWANADQYYVKTSESFEDYVITLPSGRKVRFEIKAAKQDGDNNGTRVGNDKRFVLSSEKPLEIVDGELVISFDHRSDPNKTKQDDLNKQIREAVLGAKGFAEWTRELGMKSPLPKEPDRTLLEKHLSIYTAKNTFDYFIHKDLGTFLRRELDFFIKNELMHLDDIENQSPDRVLQQVAKVRILRHVAGKIIDFLAQVEDFEKKMWLKKKFVLETQYCVTLDRVPKELYPEIAKNDPQREEWVKLFAINEILGYTVPLKPEFLRSNPHLVLDTRFFDKAFTIHALSALTPLDETIDGILICAENFQALQLLRSRFENHVDCVFIDPPYNTKSGDFLYKDNYKHSSWISMMRDRLTLCRRMLASRGVLFQHIDENEHAHASMLLTDVFGEANRVGDIVWKNSSKNDEAYVSMQHEYILGAVNDPSVNTGEWTERKEGLEEIYAAFNGFRKKHGTDWKAIHEEALKWYASFPESNPISDSGHYNWMDERGVYFPADISGPNFGQYRYKVIHPKTKKPCREPASGWRFPEETMQQRIRDGLVHFGDDETTIPGNKTYLKSTETQSLTSVKYRDGRVASKLLSNMFGKRAFSNPKDVDVTARILKATTSDNAWVLDCFAGSGTTAHAVIRLNADSGGRRRYTLCEMDSYFDTITKPRILKAIYAKEWKDGRPVARNNGVSQVLQYLRLESYEDSLANLRLQRTFSQETLLSKSAQLKSQYMLRYLLPNEATGETLMKPGNFDSPFEFRMTTHVRGESRIVRVDLLETFNLLLGLRVQRIAEADGARYVVGSSPAGEKVLVIWRVVKDLDGHALNKWFQKQGFNQKSQEFDLVYVNGSNSLESLRRPDQAWQVRLTEQAFHRLMFEVDDV